MKRRFASGSVAVTCLAALFLVGSSKATAQAAPSTGKDRDAERRAAISKIASLEANCKALIQQEDKLQIEKGTLQRFQMDQAQIASMLESRATVEEIERGGLIKIVKAFLLVDIPPEGNFEFLWKELYRQSRIAQLRRLATAEKIEQANAEGELRAVRIKIREVESQRDKLQAEITRLRSALP